MGSATLADNHFRENAVHCQDAKSILGSVKSRDKWPNWGMRRFLQCGENCIGEHAFTVSWFRRLPQRQHAVEPEAIDRLGHAALLEPPRNGAQAERIERDATLRCAGRSGR